MYNTSKKLKTIFQTFMQKIIDFQVEFIKKPKGVKNAIVGLVWAFTKKSNLPPIGILVYPQFGNRTEFVFPATSKLTNKEKTELQKRMIKEINSYLVWSNEFLEKNYRKADWAIAAYREKTFKDSPKERENLINFLQLCVKLEITKRLAPKGELKLASSSR